MDGERRAAPRHLVPSDVTADVSGTPARLLELSLVGAKVEHNDRFALTLPRLTMTWRGNAASVAVRAARSEIVGREEDRLVYHTGLHFVDVDSITRGFIASILEGAASAVSEVPIPVPRPRDTKEATSSVEDTWTRRVQLLKQEFDEDYPYAQFRLTATGWRKEYVTSPVQPKDGFTIRRDRYDFDELQRAFEAADDDTRAMMQIALESQLAKA